jgi:hypothetical protein
MSVLPLEADIHQGDGYVSFVPDSDITPIAAHDFVRVSVSARRLDK